MRHTALVFFVALISTISGLSHGDDWPRWMGPTADGVYREESVVTSLPATGLQVNWRVPVAGGYAGPAVVGDRVYVFDYQKSAGEAFNDPGRRADLKGSERLQCFHAETGEALWKYEYDCPYSISYPAGPRCTPTVDVTGPDDRGRVYILGSEGDLSCLNAVSGELIWKRSFKTDYNAVVPTWGFSSHPLVDDKLVYCMVGGQGQTVVAFDKLTGEERWKALSASAVGYCPPSMVNAGGVRQLLVWHADAIVSLDPANGKVYWDLPIQPDFEMAITRPQQEGNRFYASAIRNHSLLFELATDRPAVKELWRGEPKQAVHCANSTPIFHRGVIYGTDCNEGSLIAVNAETGDRLWSTFKATKPDETRRVSHGTAFITQLGDSDRYLLMSETGDLILANLTSSGYEELWRFHVLEPTSEAFGRDVVWSHPAYARKSAFVRNDKELVSVRLVP
ncbi:MAG: PQQ-binding-like beta-propeller repeat protein [Planctomycetaceae bacterium]